MDARPRALPALGRAKARHGASQQPQPTDMAREDAKRARALNRVQPADKLSAVGIGEQSGANGSPARSKPSTASFAHIFFNRRPLELLKRTSSLLSGGGSSRNANGSSASPAAAKPAAKSERIPETSAPLNWKREMAAAPSTTTSLASVEPIAQHRPPQPLEHVHTKPQPPVHHHHHAHHARASRHREQMLAPSPPQPKATPCARDILLHAPGELSKFEKTEILAYDQVFFYSTLSVKAQRRGGRIVSALPTHGDDNPIDDDEQNQEGGNPPVEYNDGFDDERGDYLMLMQDHLAYRFEVLRALGRGSFGQVVLCLDHKLQRQVAIKVIRNRAKYAEQAMLEVQLLTQLARADAPARSNVVQMHECFRFRNHVCIVFELLGLNLYDFLKLRYFQGLEMPQIRRVAKQLAEALLALKDLDIIHCDLKPENVLIRPDPTHPLTAPVANNPVNAITLIDFGSACLQTSGAMFTYVQSRFYRSPEVILGHAYTTSIDMWSLACILVELYTGHPIFAGENEREQLACIMEMLGVPPLPYLLKCKRRRHFFDEPEGEGSDSMDGISMAASIISGPRFVPKPFVNSRGRRRMPGARSLYSAVQTGDEGFLAFLAKCFVWEPDQRLTPEQALQDPWILGTE